MLEGRHLEHVDRHFAESMAVLKNAIDSRSFVLATCQVAAACTTCLRAGGKILLAGNGGSAGDAQHIAGEFLSRFEVTRVPLAAIALTADTSVLTAVGNDFGYDEVFARQVHGLARAGDVLIAMSTSGRSPNILRALEAGSASGCINVGFGGRHSAMAPFCNICLEVPSSSPPLIQQAYMMAAHAICGEVERELFVTGEVHSERV